jgi:hypothetical protein
MTETRRVHRSVATTVLVGAVVLSGLVPARALAQGSGIEPKVTVSRLTGGRALIEVSDADVTVRKELAGHASHVTITTRRDELQLRVVRDQLTVSTPGGTVSVSAAHPEEMARLMAVLQRSDAASRGRDLLRRVPANPKDFGQQSLLLTRAVLELAHGASPALVAHRQWVARERARLGVPVSGPAVMRVGLQTRGPGDCWDLYSKEAIRIADDFAECTDDLKWYDALGWAGCSLIYTIRAEGAMFWFISCNGGIPFQG